MNVNDEEKALAIKTAIQELCKRSLYKTCRHLLGYTDVEAETHGDMIRALCSPSERKLIVMPRGTLKSSIGVVGYAIWRLLKDPNLRILIDSEVYSNSKNFLREIRAHLESERVTNAFGQFKSDNWSEGEITISQRVIPKKEASITCGGIGTVKVGQHYDVIIMDDLNSQNNSQTVEGRAKVVQHYRMNQAILDPGGTIVVIGTRYATDDIIGHILENEIGGEYAEFNRGRSKNLPNERW